MTVISNRLKQPVVQEPVARSCIPEESGWGLMARGVERGAHAPAPKPVGPPKRVEVGMFDGPMYPFEG